MSTEIETCVPVEALRELQRTIGNANAAKGFHEEGDALRYARYGEGGGILHTHDQADVRNLRTYYSEKLLLIVSEAIEAHDELRDGHEVHETYYPTRVYEKGANGVYQITDVETVHKPEGVPSELADVVIRAFDFADEANIDLAAMIAEKLAYNATRPRLHGKTF